MHMKHRRCCPVTYVVIAVQSPSQAPQELCHETSLNLVHSLLSILPDLTVLLLLVDPKGSDVDLHL